MKKWFFAVLSILLCISICLSGSAFMAFAEEQETWDEVFTIDEFVERFNELASKESYSIVYKNEKYEAQWAGLLPLLTLNFGTNADNVVVKIVLRGEEATNLLDKKMDVCQYVHQIINPHLSILEQWDDFSKVFANGDSCTETINDIQYSYTLDRGKNTIEYSITNLSSIQTSSQIEEDSPYQLISKAKESIDSITNGILEALEYWNNNAFSTIEDIQNYEAMWQALADEADVVITYVNGITPTAETKTALSKLLTGMEDVKNTLANCSNMDVNGDGTYTGDEMGDLLNNTISSVVISLEAVTSYCEQFDEALSKSVGDIQSEDLGIWVFDQYIDRFQQPTGDYYIRNQEYLHGTFSNSSATNEDLSVVIAIDKHMNITIQMYEYGRYRVKNGFSKDIPYTIYVRDMYGNENKLYADMYSNTDYLLLSDSSATKLIEMLKNNDSISFCIEQSNKALDRYLFSITATAGLEEALNLLFLK